MSEIMVVELKIQVPRKVYDIMSRVAEAEGMTVNDLILLAINEIIKKYEKKTK